MGYFIRNIVTTRMNIGDSDFLSVTLSVTNRNKRNEAVTNEPTVLSPESWVLSWKATKVRAGLTIATKLAWGRIKIKSKSMSKIGRTPPALCWTREPVNPIGFVGRN